MKTVDFNHFVPYNK